MTRVLFVCSRNRLRSPTAEQVYSGHEGLEVTSAGLDNDADVACTGELVAWAEVIFVMERKHRTKLGRRFRRHLGGARVVCLDIADRYAFVQPELIALLHRRVDPHLRRGSSGGATGS